jgi:uncharacterized repeat protein (TIGR01451 family)
VPTWGAWTINPGGVVTINFVADIASDVTAGVYDNTARATSDQTSLIDDNGTAGQDTNTPLGGDPENDEDVTVSTEADLAITKIDDPDPVVAGGTLTYTIQVVNNGPSDAQNVVVADTLDAETTFVAAPGCTETAGTVTCNLGTVPNGAVVNITIVVTVAPDLLAFAGTGNYVALATVPATTSAAAAATLAQRMPAARTAAVDDLATAPKPGELPSWPATSGFAFNGGGGGPGSPTVGSGLTAAPVGPDSLLALSNADQLQQAALAEVFGVTAADTLSRAGPPEM